jgi:superfamily II DNA or RNA helicase
VKRAPRPYQRDAIAAVQGGWTDARRQLVVMATGTGKTTVLAGVAEAERKHGRVLVLAHREELLDQAAARFREWTDLWCSIEQADRRAEPMSDVVIASVQTLARESRLRTFDAREFGLVIVDEAHHAPSESYQKVLQHFGDARIAGFTATPDRLDKASLKGTFDRVAYIYEIRDAIGDGWLVPIRQKIAFIQTLDLGAVRTVAGDLSERDLEAAMIRHEVPHAVARATAESAGDRPTLVFAATIAHAKILAEAMKHYAPADKILAVSGEDPREYRRDALARFRAGDVQFLVNCALWTEGFDEPSIACVSIARPTKSRALYTQMSGRALRTLDGLNYFAERAVPSPKRDCVILDFTGNAGRHSLINVFDLLGGDDAEIKAKATARATTSPDGVDVLDELRQQQDAMADFLRRQAMEAAQRTRQTTIGYRDVDPFRKVYSILKIRPLAGRMGGVEPTEQQLDVLRQHKVDQDMNLRDLDRGQASEIIANIQERPRKGQCTYKQARQLLRFGYDPDVSFEEARRVIDALAANGWRRPSRVS